MLCPKCIGVPLTERPMCESPRCARYGVVKTLWYTVIDVQHPLSPTYPVAVKVLFWKDGSATEYFRILNPERDIPSPWVEIQ